MWFHLAGIWHYTSKEITQNYFRDNSIRAYELEYPREFMSDLALDFCEGKGS